MIMSFCGHLSIKIDSTKKAKKMAWGVQNPNLLEGKAINFFQDVLAHASSRNQALDWGKHIWSKIEILQAQLSQAEVPVCSSNLEVSMALHRRLMKDYVTEAAQLAKVAATDLEEVAQCHNRFHQNLCKYYVQPMGNQTTGPFVLKQEWHQGNAIPLLHKFEITVCRSPEHKTWSEKVITHCQDHIVAQQMAKAGKEKAKDEAVMALRHPSTLSYDVYHPGLVACNLADLAFALPVVPLALEAFRKIGSTKANLIAKLVIKMLRHWGEAPSCLDMQGQPSASNASPCPILEQVLPPSPSEGQKRNKIIIFFMHSVICSYVGWHLKKMHVRFLNLFGGNNKDQGQGL